MPNGLTQKWSGSSGSRAVMWPAVPSLEPELAEQAEGGGEPLLAMTPFFFQGVELWDGVGGAV